MKKDDMKKHNAIYVRAARHADDAADGLTAQTYRCRQWLTAMHGEEAAKHVSIYMDDGVAATNAHRPGIIDLLRDVRDGRVTRVVCSDVTRLTRSVADFLKLLEELRQQGVEVVFLREQVDTGTHHGRALVTILAALSEIEHIQEVKHVPA